MAVSQMLMGRNGVHLSATPQAARSACEYAKGWLKTNGFFDQTTVPVAAGNVEVRFGTATLKFLPMSACLRGMRVDIIKDHCVLECEAAEAIKQARRADAATIKELMLKNKWYSVKIPGTFRTGTTLLIRD